MIKVIIINIIPKYISSNIRDYLNLQIEEEKLEKIDTLGFKDS